MSILPVLTSPHLGLSWCLPSPSPEPALTKEFCARVQIRLQSQLPLSHQPSSPKSKAFTSFREQQAAVFPGDWEEEPSSRPSAALLVLVFLWDLTPCGTWEVLQCSSSMSFVLMLKKNRSIIFLYLELKRSIKVLFISYGKVNSPPLLTWKPRHICFQEQVQVVERAYAWV